MRKDLERNQKTDGNFEENQLWNLNNDVIAAGAFMQDNNITMMDLCPSSIMLSPQGVVKIGDFHLLKEG